MGTVTICNLKAPLYDENFDFGGTTKKDKPNQAGKHGEGFKNAALVLRRHPCNFSVRIIASSSYVNFTFNTRKKLVARITAIKNNKIRQKQAYFDRKESDGLRKILEPKPWEDVCWELGFPRKVKVLDGSESHTSAISLHEFKDWLTVTTLINPPTHKIRTSHGDLIFDQRFAGKVFLRALELPNSSASGKRFRYAYDLNSGSTGRDRTSLSNAQEESALMAKIWSEALSTSKDGRTKDGLIKKYVAMIENDEAADVHGARSHLEKEVVRPMWRYLLTKASSREPSGFYYCPDIADEGARHIQDHLQQDPLSLNKSMWEILRDHGFCHTVEEERQRIFQNLEPADMSDLSTFSWSLLRLLKACLWADPCTADKQLIIVDGGALNIRTHYDADAKLWKVDKKLFDIAACHEKEPLCEALKGDDVKDGTPENTFWCNHAVRDLFGTMLLDLSKEVLRLGTDAEAGFEQQRILHKGSRLIARVPQNVVLEPTLRPGELHVKWDHVETGLALKYSQSSYVVGIHRTGGCQDKTAFVLHSANTDTPCADMRVQVPLHTDSHTFSNLALGHAYFATIHHNNDIAIYATSVNECHLIQVPHLVDLSQDKDHEIGVGQSAPSISRRPASPIAGAMDVDSSGSDDSSNTDNQLSTAASSGPRGATVSGLRRLTGSLPRVGHPTGSSATLHSSLRQDRQPLAKRENVLQAAINDSEAVVLENITYGEFARREWREGRAHGTLNGVLIGVPKLPRGEREQEGTNTDGHPARRARFSS